MKAVLSSLSFHCLALSLSAVTWTLDDRFADTLIVHGDAKIREGAVTQSLVLDGESLIEIKNSAGLCSRDFTVSVWFDLYELDGVQQLIMGKNRDSRGERQWCFTIEPDGRLKAYLQQGGWSTISCYEPLRHGTWHFAALAVNGKKAALFLNGEPVGETTLKAPIAETEAPITLGGIRDAKSMQ